MEVRFDSGTVTLVAAAKFDGATMAQAARLKQEFGHSTGGWTEEGRRHTGVSEQAAARPTDSHVTVRVVNVGKVDEEIPKGTVVGMACPEFEVKLQHTRDYDRQRSTCIRFPNRQGTATREAS